MCVELTISPSCAPGGGSVLHVELERGPLPRLLRALDRRAQDVALLGEGVRARQVSGRLGGLCCTMLMLPLTALPPSPPPMAYHAALLGEGVRARQVSGHSGCGAER